MASLGPFPQLFVFLRSRVSFKLVDVLLLFVDVRVVVDKDGEKNDEYELKYDESGAKLPRVLFEATQVVRRLETGLLQEVALSQIDLLKNLEKIKENMFLLSDAFSWAGLVTSTVTVVDFLGFCSSSVEAPARPTPARARIPETLLLKNELFFCSYIFSFSFEL